MESSRPRRQGCPRSCLWTPWESTTPKDLPGTISKSATACCYSRAQFDMAVRACQLPPLKNADGGVGCRSARGAWVGNACPGGAVATVTGELESCLRLHPSNTSDLARTRQGPRRELHQPLKSSRREDDGDLGTRQRHGAAPMGTARLLGKQRCNSRGCAASRRRRWSPSFASRPTTRSHFPS